MQSSSPADGSSVNSVASIKVVASEAVAAVQGATLDGNPATGEISGSQVTFSLSTVGLGEHTLTGTLVDAAGNTGTFRVSFTVKVVGNAALVVKVEKPIVKANAANRVFIIPVSLSAPAKVKATLLSPSGKKLRTSQTNLTAGQHSLKFTLPTASLPPGRYTILVVATAADGTRIVKRVSVKIKKAQSKPPAAKHKTTRPHAKAVLIPVAPKSPPRGDSTPPASSTKAPVIRHKAPSLKSLETATSYIKGAGSMRNIGLGIVFICFGGLFALLIKIELGRMLSTPRRPA
jgi:methionine-rich copper-binding protein CopC